MKKVLVIVVLGLSLSAAAQSLTLQTGISHSYMPIHTDNQHDDPHTSFRAPAIKYSAGVSLNLGKNPMLYYSADLHLYRAGGKGKKGTKSPQVKMDYVALGGSVHFSPMKGKTKVELEAGPRANYMYHGQESEELYNYNKYKKLRRFNYGWNAGIGVYHQLATARVGIRGIWVHNLKQVIDLDEWVVPVVPTNATERTFLIQLCFEKPLKSAKS